MNKVDNTLGPTPLAFWEKVGGGWPRISFSLIFFVSSLFIFPVSISRNWKPLSWACFIYLDLQSFFWNMLSVDDILFLHVSSPIDILSRYNPSTCIIMTVTVTKNSPFSFSFFPTCHRCKRYFHAHSLVICFCMYKNALIKLGERKKHVAECSRACTEPWGSTPGVSYLQEILTTSQVYCGP